MAKRAGSGQGREEGGPRVQAIAFERRGNDRLGGEGRRAGEHRLPGDETSKTEKKVLKRAAKELILVPCAVDMNPIHIKKPRWFSRGARAKERK
ncbi:MAG TPA: hypothetical protein VLU38_01025 [Methanomassiliicoccales archaeon]|nr:hypothetical protein [Methanomassiliicoccales archaeon]